MGDSIQLGFNGDNGKYGKIIIECIYSESFVNYHFHFIKCKAEINLVMFFFFFGLANLVVL